MEDVGAAGKLGDLDLDLGTLEDPSFYFTLHSRRKFLVTIQIPQHGRTRLPNWKLPSCLTRGTSRERVLFTLALFTCQPFFIYLHPNDAKQDRDVTSTVYV